MTTEINVNLPPWQNRITVYQVDTEGNASIVQPKIPEGCFLIGIHKYAGEVAFEWSMINKPRFKFLTGKDGTSFVEVVDGGRIIGIGQGVAATVSPGPSGVSEVLLVPLK